jgi:hypothetical protein
MKEHVRQVDVFPENTKGHLSLMETDRELMHEIEPILEVVEGDPSQDENGASEPVTAIVPNAFETVLAQYDESQTPKYIEPEAPVYKNRALIAVICVLAGIFAGRLTTQPKVVTQIVTKEVPTVTFAKPDVQKVDNAFRDLTDLKNFDPWQPMNGGFPLPPKATQANIVARGGGSSQPFNPPPPSMRGNITPLDPTDMGGPLPNIGGKGISLPQNPEPAGKNPKTAATDSQGTPTIAATGKDAVIGKERYVAFSVNGPEPTQGQSTLSSLATSMGGTARTFTHMAEDGTVEAQGVLLIIPASKYDAVKSKIEALGGATIDSNIDGNATSEQGRIQSSLIARLAKLRDKKKDLLVDFLEDAQPVKQISEAIDYESRAVSATRLPAGLTGKVVIRVMLK